MIDLNDMGREIARRRSVAKLTQAELAGRARIGRSTLDALENGRASELGFGKIVRLLAALGLELRIAERRTSRPTLEALLNDDVD